jgi:hypothetical protein
MTIAARDLLGIGLYTPADAAFLARVSTQLMNRWLYGNQSGEPVLCPQIEDPDEKIVTFLDFVQTLAIRAIRVQHNVPLQKIRQAVEVARDHFHIEYPFAMDHTTYLFGNELLIRVGKDKEGTDEFVQASGKHARNRMLTKVIEVYLRDLTFNPEGLAAAYRAFAWKDFEVVMDPAVRFGEPLVKSCGYSAQALWEASLSEGGIENAARAYGVKVREVELACRYFDHLKSNLAA